MNAQQFMTWWQGLPAWAHPALIAEFIAAPVIAWLTIRHKLRMTQQGWIARAALHLKFGHAVLIFAALYFLKENNAAVAALLTWPARTFPYYAAHGGALWLGAVNGGYTGVKLGKWLMPVVLRLHGVKGARAGSQSFAYPGQMPGGAWVYPSQENEQWEDE